MTGMRTAKYLLRFDDICPTMDWRTWLDIESILRDHAVLPILAVIPDNQDETLHYGPAVHDFWERVRTWQSYGWTIAQHGYQHRYVTKNAGIIGINRYSEFAGLSQQEQIDKLCAGAEIFRREGIMSRTWIAPAHSFDHTTLALLPKVGLDVISDGFARYPYVTDEHIIWVPQQLWEYQYRRTGIWTICHHHSCWTASQQHDFTQHLFRTGLETTSLDAVLQLYAHRRRSLGDVVAEVFSAVSRALP